MLADMVTPGNRLVDIGCDHGFLSIYLVSEGICPKALAMDVREGPLTAAGTHVAEWGLEDYIEIRLSDGLKKYRAGEADTMVCAGMGGRLMKRILEEGMDKAAGMKELILQPQSELSEFRSFLRQAGFRVTQEDAIREDGKYYFAMKAVPVREQTGDGKPEEGKKAGNGKYRESRAAGAGDAGSGKESAADRCQPLYDQYGELLLKGRHPVLLQYLRQRESYVRQLEASLFAADSQKAKNRLEEVGDELKGIEEALTFFCEG